MKIIIVLATGTLLHFPMNPSVEPSCFIQGQTIIENIARYNYTGNRDQGWYLKETNIPVMGHYCE